MSDGGVEGVVTVILVGCRYYNLSRTSRLLIRSILSAVSSSALVILLPLAYPSAG